MDLPEATKALYARPLWGWFWRFGGVGAVCAPAVLFVAATIPGGWFSADMIAFSPVLGALVGMGCGTVGWLVTLWAAKQHARPEQT